MTRQGDFLIYCVETYKNARHLTGRQVAELFTRYDVWDYVYFCYSLKLPPKTAHSPFKSAYKSQKYMQKEPER